MVKKEVDYLRYVESRKSSLQCGMCLNKETNVWTMERNDDTNR